MVEHEWCTLYVETTLSSRELGFVLARAVGGVVDAEAFGTEIRSEGVDISVRKNDDVARCTCTPDFSSACTNFVAVGKSGCVLGMMYARASRSSGFLSSAM